MTWTHSTSAVSTGYRKHNTTQPNSALQRRPQDFFPCWLRLEGVGTSLTSSLIRKWTWCEDREWNRNPPSERAHNNKSNSVCRTPAEKKARLSAAGFPRAMAWNQKSGARVDSTQLWSPHFLRHERICISVESHPSPSIGLETMSSHMFPSRKWQGSHPVQASSWNRSKPRRQGHSSARALPGQCSSC